MIKNKTMFLAMRNLFHGGEFSKWLEQQAPNMPVAAFSEYEEAYQFFCQETGFVVEEQNAENDNSDENAFAWEDERDTMQDLTCVPDIIA